MAGSIGPIRGIKRMPAPRGVSIQPSLGGGQKRLTPEQTKRIMPEGLDTFEGWEGFHIEGPRPLPLDVMDTLQELVDEADAALLTQYPDRRPKQ